MRSEELDSIESLRLRLEESEKQNKIWRVRVQVLEKEQKQEIQSLIKQEKDNLKQIVEQYKIFIDKLIQDKQHMSQQLQELQQ